MKYHFQPRRLSAYILVILCCIKAAGAQSPSDVKVTVEPRIELLTIVQALGERATYPLPCRYNSDVEKWFKPYRKDAAVDQIKMLLPPASSDGAFPLIAMYCTPLPAFQPYLPFMAQQDTAAKNEYLRLCKEFYGRSHFNEFMELHQSDFDAWSKQVTDTISKYELTAHLSNFMGQQRTWNIYLSPLVSWGAYNFILPTAASDQEINFVLGFTTWKKGHHAKKEQPFFADKNALINLVWHEGSHSYIGPLIQQDAIVLNVFSYLLTDTMQSHLQAAGRFQWTWEYYLNELTVRAIVAKLTSAYFGEAAGEAELVKQEKLGFEHIRGVYKLLEKYEQQRTIDPSVDIQYFWNALMADLPNWSH